MIILMHAEGCNFYDKAFANYSKIKTPFRAIIVNMFFINTQLFLKM